MGWIDNFDLDKNDSPEALGATLAMYGLIISIGFLMLLIGVTGLFVYAFRGGVTAPTSLLLGMIISTIIGLTGMTVAAGGAGYAVLQAIRNE